MPRIDYSRTFSAINPTPGTGIASAITAAFADTAALLSIRNGGVERIRLNYVRLITTVAPASATSSELVVVIDTGTARRASGGTQLVMRHRGHVTTYASEEVSNAVVFFGAVVTTAEGANSRRIARAKLRQAIQVVGDEYVIVFGERGGEVSEHAHHVFNGTNPQRNITHAGPVELGLNSDCLLHVWHPGNAVTPASYEVEVNIDAK